MLRFGLARRYAVWMHVVRWQSGFWPYAFFHKLPSIAIAEVCIAALALQAFANWLVGRHLLDALRWLALRAFRPRTPPGAKDRTPELAVIEREENLSVPNGTVNQNGVEASAKKDA